MSEFIFDEWFPYIEYEKHECDIKLKDGTIIYHLYPNAGKFHTLCQSKEDSKSYPESDVAEIRYRKYYEDDLCKGNCNGKLNKRRVAIIGVATNPELAEEAVLHLRTTGNDVVVVDKYRDLSSLSELPLA